MQNHSFASQTIEFAEFAAQLNGDDLVARLRDGIIGEGIEVDGPFGPKKLVYADYVASGRALSHVEQFVMTHVLPYYANSHTESSYCGQRMTTLRRAARAEIAALTGADASYGVIFTGAGATAGLNRLPALLGIPQALADGRGATVFIGPYEHHSNILPWRESGAQTIEIPEGPDGGPDLNALTNALEETPASHLKIGAFSAASNVTGITTDTDKVTRILNAHGAKSVWDYAGGAPYLPIDMGVGSDAQKTAVVASAHKFIGGPGASGVLILQRAAVSRHAPVVTGGGTVRFVSPWAHDYSDDVVVREEAGTPNVIGDIRAGLVFLVKAALGAAFMAERQAALRARALAVWTQNPAIEIIGLAGADKPGGTPTLPIFSLRIKDMERGGYLHQQLVTHMLSDGFGIQARGGCACAGPYAHRLLGIDRDTSDKMRAAILSGAEMEKPGWTRVNLSVLCDDAKADYIIGSIDGLARAPYPMADAYFCDTATAKFSIGKHAA